LTDLSRLSSAVISDNFNFDRAKPLLSTVLNNESDELIWDKVYCAVTESTPPPRPLSSFPQTPWLRNTSSFGREMWMIARRRSYDLGRGLILGRCILEGWIW